MLGTDLVHELSTSHEVVGVDLPEVDLTQPGSLRRAVETAAPDAVVNTAAFTRVDDCETHRELAFAVNADGVRNLAKACRTASVPLLHLSTDYVFGGEGRRPWREDDPAAPRGVYAESKRAGELAVAAELSEGGWTTVRTQWLFGRNGPNFVEAILRQLKPGARLRVVADQRGRPTWTRDLARGLRWLVETGRGHGYVNVANDGEATWCEFAEAIVRESGVEDVQVAPIATADAARPAPRPAYSVLDLGRFESITGRLLADWHVALGGYLRERG